MLTVSLLYLTFTFQVLTRADRLVAVVKDIDNGAGSLGFDSQADQIRLNAADASSPLLCFFAAVLLSAKPRRWAPPLVTRCGIILRV